MMLALLALLVSGWVAPACLRHCGDAGWRAREDGVGVIGLRSGLSFWWATPHDGSLRYCAASCKAACAVTKRTTSRSAQ
jgi:hypothetical protein